MNMVESDTDPLEGAAVGETRTVRVTDHDSPWYRTATDVFSGSDRDCGPIRLVDARVEGDPGNEDLILEWEVDVTKQLPRGWDRPITDHPRYVRDQPQTTKQRARHLVGKALSIVLPVGFAFGIAALIFDRMEPIELTINGETTTFPLSLSEMAPVLMTVALFTIFLMVIIPYLPGMAHRGNRYA